MNEPWELYKNRKVRLFIIDSDGQIKTRDGIFYDSSETHLFIFLTKKAMGNYNLNIEYSTIPTSFLKTSIKRVEVKDDN
jgi:hypothetical protein